MTPPSDLRRIVVERACHHGEFESHSWAWSGWCPGGSRRIVSGPTPEVLVIERDENGEWPEKAQRLVQAVTQFKSDLLNENIGNIVLDALATQMFDPTEGGSGG